MSNNLILWEVFIQSKVNLPYKHVGNVHASDSEMALQNARDFIQEEMRVQVFGL